MRRLANLLGCRDPEYKSPSPPAEPEGSLSITTPEGFDDEPGIDSSAPVDDEVVCDSFFPPFFSNFGPVLLTCLFYLNIVVSWTQWDGRRVSTKVGLHVEAKAVFPSLYSGWLHQKRKGKEDCQGTEAAKEDEDGVRWGGGGWGWETTT